MIDVIVLVAPFSTPFGMLTCSMNMTNALILILFMWLKSCHLTMVQCV
jgi:hypothetical protein